MRARITTFAGVRATGDTGDFEIGEVPSAPGFFDIACFESPGLTSAPAVAVDMAARIAEKLNAAENPQFNPILLLPALFKNMNEEERRAAISVNPDAGHMLCRCNEVTEADVASALHTKLPVLCLDALKWRTARPWVAATAASACPSSQRSWRARPHRSERAAEAPRWFAHRCRSARKLR